MDNLSLLTEEIKNYQNNICLNFILIGRNLTKIKEEKLYKPKYLTFHGYIEKNFDFSLRTALMYRAVSQKPEIAKFGISKALLLLRVPELIRKQIIKKHDVENISVRKLKELLNQFVFTKEPELLEFEEKTTMIPIKEATKRELFSFKEFKGETYDNIINKLLHEVNQ